VTTQPQQEFPMALCLQTAHTGTISHYNFKLEMIVFSRNLAHPPTHHHAVASSKNWTKVNIRRVLINWFSVSLCTSLTVHHHSTHSCP